jgi:hypothetical protein
LICCASRSELERVAVLSSGRPGAVTTEQVERRRIAAKALQIELFDIPIRTALNR